MRIAYMGPEPEVILQFSSGRGTFQWLQGQTIEVPDYLADRVLRRDHFWKEEDLKQIWEKQAEETKRELEEWEQSKVEPEESPEDSENYWPSGDSLGDEEC